MLGGLGNIGDLVTGLFGGGGGPDKAAFEKTMVDVGATWFLTTIQQPLWAEEMEGDEDDEV